MLLCWRARWSAGRRKIQMWLWPQVWASVRLGLNHSFTHAALNRSRWKITCGLLQTQPGLQKYSFKVFIPQLSSIHYCLIYFREVCPRQLRCCKTLIDVLMTKLGASISGLSLEPATVWVSWQFWRPICRKAIPAWLQAVSPVTLKRLGFSTLPSSSWALQPSFPTGAVINVSVLGVGVIYNPLHVQHSLPQAGANK